MTTSAFCHLSSDYAQTRSGHRLRTSGYLPYLMEKQFRRPCDHSRSVLKQFRVAPPNARPQLWYVASLIGVWRLPTAFSPPSRIRWGRMPYMIPRGTPVNGAKRQYPKKVGGTALRHLEGSEKTVRPTLFLIVPMMGSTLSRNIGSYANNIFQETPCLVMMSMSVLAVKLAALSLMMAIGGVRMDERFAHQRRTCRWNPSRAS